MADKQATRDAYGIALQRIGNQRDDIVVLDADLSGSTRSKKFGAEHPDKFFNVGIAEQNLIGMSAGFASTGKTVFASTFSMFITGRVYDQIRQNLARPRARVRIVGSHGGITVGEDGPSHQACEDVGLMRLLPDMQVWVPADGPETESMVEASLEIDGPVFIRTGRSKCTIFHDASYKFTPGKGEIVRHGKDLTLIAMGIMVSACLEAADKLAADGIDARVVNMASVKPIDEDLIVRCAKETGRIITAEEHSIIGGLGAAVAEICGEKCPVPVKRIGMRDEFGKTGPANELLEYFHLTAADVEQAARAFVK
jgi:transketolase